MTTDTLREAVARAIFETWAKASYKHDHPMRWDDALLALAERDKFPKMSVIVPMCRAEATAALSAIEAAGWRIVPVEPTDDQFHAGEDARKDHTAIYFDGSEVSSSDMVNHVYTAMLAAAPRLDATVRSGEEG